MLSSLLLLKAGDVEVNPGPNTRKEQNTSADGNISSVLNEINSNLQALNKKVDKITNDLALLTNRIDEVEENQISLKEEFEELKEKMDYIQARCDNFESQSRRDNLIFYGVDDDKNETWAETENKVRTIMKDKMKIDPSQIQIQRSHRLNTGSSPRPVIVKFLKYKDKEFILREGIKCLREGAIWVSEDFTKQVREL